MKKRTILLIMDVAYLVMMIACSIFYLFGNFGKALPAQMGLAQLIFSIVAAIVYLIKNWYEDSGLSVFLHVFYSLAQCVAVYYWILYSWAKFEVFRGVVVISWQGLTVHVLLIVWGIGMIVMKRNNPKPIEHTRKGDAHA